jgi:hypothetical protein
VSETIEYNGVLDDANKTPLTRAVTQTAMLWMRERGFKPLACEVPVREGWCADIAGLTVPTRGEAMKLRLMGPRPKWNPGPGFREQHDAREAAYMAIPSPLAAVMEVKVTRADFLRDRTRKFAGPAPAHLCYLAVPAGLLKPEEYPIGWGMVICSQDGGMVRQSPKTAVLHAVEPAAILLMAWGLAVKVDHDQRYGWLRERRKAEATRETATRIRYRVGNIAQTLLDLVRGREPLGMSRMPEGVQREFKMYAKLLTEALGDESAVPGEVAGG